MALYVLNIMNNRWAHMNSTKIITYDIFYYYVTHRQLHEETRVNFYVHTCKFKNKNI